MVDQDGDGALNQDEFGSALYGGYDADESGGLDEEESASYGAEAEEGGWFE